MKKARNRSRLFSRFLALNCNNGNLSRYTASFREVTREMTNAGVKLDDDLLAHMTLHHLPDNHSTTKQVIIATSEASNSALSVAIVLNQINELVRDDDVVQSNATAYNTRSKNKSINYERGSNGTHNPKTAHTGSSCWQVHPDKNPRQKSQLNSAQQSNTASITGRALSTLAQTGNASGRPILDTACSQTIIHDKRLFQNYSGCDTEIEVAGSDSIKGVGIGSIKGTHRGSFLSFSNCLHVPVLRSNPISMLSLAKKGCSINFKDNGNFVVIQDRDGILSGNLVNGVMELDLELCKSLIPSSTMAM